MDKDRKSRELADFLFGISEEHADLTNGELTVEAQARLRDLVALSLSRTTSSGGVDIETQTLAAYIDGGLDEADRTALERRLLSEPEFVEELAAAHAWLARHGQAATTSPRSLIDGAKALAPIGRIAEQAAKNARGAGWRPARNWFAPMSAAASYGLVAVVVLAAIGYGTYGYYGDEKFAPVTATGGSFTESDAPAPPKLFADQLTRERATAAATPT